MGLCHPRGMIVVYAEECAMLTPTFDEVLASARQLPVEDQLRLRDALPVQPSEHEAVSRHPDSTNSSPFGTLAEMIDEPPQNRLHAEDQELYGR